MQQRGFDKATAERYACLLADGVELDASGKWVMRDQAGNIID